MSDPVTGVRAQRKGGGPAALGSPRKEAGIRPIRRAKVSDAIAGQIQELLLLGVYEVGDRLPSERVLVEKYGVGRTSIREAMRSLEARGLVEIRHGLGVVVVRREAAPLGAPVRAAYAPADALEVRGMLQREAAALALERATERDLREIAALVEPSGEAPASGDGTAVVDAGLRRALVDAAGNPLLSWLYDTITPLCGAAPRAAPAPSGPEGRNGSGPARIAAVARTGDVGATIAAVRDYLDVADRLTVASLRTHDGTGAPA